MWQSCLPAFWRSMLPGCSPVTPIKARHHRPATFLGPNPIPQLKFQGVPPCVLFLNPPSSITSCMTCAVLSSTRPPVWRTRASASSSSTLATPPPLVFARPMRSLRTCASSCPTAKAIPTRVACSPRARRSCSTRRSRACPTFRWSISTRATACPSSFSFR